MLYYTLTLTVVFILFGAGLTNAQSQPISLTSACSSTLLGLLGSPDTQCLKLGSLLSYFINPDISVPKAADKWLSGLCGASSCTDNDIANIVSNITRGCSEDFSNTGVNIINLSDQVTAVTQQVYPTIRQVACSNDPATNELCVPQSLRNIEAMFGKLSLNNLTLDTLSQDAQIFLNAYLTSIACTDCTKAAYHIGMYAFPDRVSQANFTLEHACGASFLYGNATSSDIVQVAPSNGMSVDLVNARANSGFNVEPFTLAGRWGLWVIFCATVLLG